MKRNTVLIAMFLLACLPGGLAAKEKTESFAILGGSAWYDYTADPDPLSIVLFNIYNLSQTATVGTPVRTIADLEQYSQQRWEGRGTVGKLQYERLLLDSKSLGLTAGVTHSTYNEKCVSGCPTFTRIHVLQTILNSNSGPYLGSYFISEAKIGYQMTTLDVGLNYHFAPLSVVDPYIGLGGGIGVCYIYQVEAGTQCSGSRVGLRLGARVNFGERVFLIVQGEADRLQMSISSPSVGSGNAVLPVPDQHVLGGIGINF